MPKSEYPAIARALAEKFAERMPVAYEKSVIEYLEHYNEPPDEDDLWAWLEGYSWADPE